MEGVLLGNSGRSLKPVMAVMFIIYIAFQKVPFDLKWLLCLLQRGRLGWDHDPGIHMLN